MLLAPTVTALQTLLEVCHAYAGPHDIVYNTTKTVCMLVRPKQSQGRYSTRVCLGNEEFSFVVEFRWLGHVMTADCRGDKDIKRTIQEAKRSWQYAGHEVLICTYWGKNPIVQVILLLHLWMCSFSLFIPELLENLLSVIVSHSNDLLTSPDTPASVWHLRWTQLTTSMWCSANLPTA